ncbi:hypothetical protein [Bacillus sp. PS06]|uniref:hypothetical protein n=1 Tax=Bacillus sp. PS06 TaxID=2764176 RepID=UPI001782A7FC|nr:hypothetical protein [Bacillus sp. PS06]MBD8069371.1 hypothetical protein [Bacillus sp. PS06]
MRKLHLDNINKTIDKRKKEVNELLAINSSTRRKKRSRVRSKGEREALDQISKKRWEKSVEKGEIKKLGDRKWYYDHTTV